MVNGCSVIHKYRLVLLVFGLVLVSLYVTYFSFVLHWKWKGTKKHCGKKSLGPKAFHIFTQIIKQQVKPANYPGLNNSLARGNLHNGRVPFLLLQIWSVNI